MAAGIYDIVIDQGSRWSLNFTWLDSVGDPVDLTGYTFEAQVRTTYAENGGELLASMTSTIDDIEGGVFTLSLTATVTEDLPAGAWVWDVEANPGDDDDIERLVMGRVVVRGEVTR